MDTRDGILFRINNSFIQNLYRLSKGYRLTV
uniref:Uncharacterized protein n=1 Tax=Siphoviridae sp. ctKcB20 TaxID=2827568 RepID=A0A8S5LLC3_9CAUD|nr:MAG TPA: hypothetical protein [Siphoviridae sp. ctKcB20]